MGAGQEWTWMTFAWAQARSKPKMTTKASGVKTDYVQNDLWCNIAQERSTPKTIPKTIPDTKRPRYLDVPLRTSKWWRNKREREAGCEHSEGRQNWRCEGSKEQPDVSSQ